LISASELYQRCVRTAPVEGLPCIPLAATDALENALIRYLAATGVSEGEVDAEIVADDRSKLGHLLEQTPSGIPVLSAESEAAFMSAVSKLPLSWCATWAYKDWIQIVAGGCVDGNPEHLIAEAYNNALRIASGDRRAVSPGLRCRRGCSAAARHADLPSTGSSS
jgi:hypothetical protein